MTHETPAQQHARYIARRAEQRCTDCPNPARQAPDGHWMSLCERCGAAQCRRSQRRYLRLLAEHKCVSCQAPAAQHADGSWYTRCTRHMLAIATYDGARAAKKVTARQQKGRN